MTEEEPFFISRNGAVWACWLDGRPAMKLGTDTGVLTAMAQFVAEAGGGKVPAAELPSETPVETPPPAPAPTPPPAAAPEPAPAAAPAPAEARAPLGERQPEERERIEARHDIAILGRVRTALGPRDVTVLDLSERGCRFQNNFGPLAVRSSLTIKLGPIGPIDATVRWTRGEYVGIEFNTPLYPSVLEHIRRHFDVRR